MPSEDSAERSLERLFIAIELPDSLLDGLAAVQKGLQALDLARAVRWSAIGGIHLTLKFLGETPADRKGAIEQALREAVQGIPAFELAVVDTGGFPDLRRPRVIWAGCNGELATLRRLRDAVEDTVAPLGYPTEDRPFSPHLTLGRARPEAQRDALAALGERVAAFKIDALPAWRVESLSLMKSDLRPQGAIYTQQAAIALPG